MLLHFPVQKHKSYTDDNKDRFHRQPYQISANIKYLVLYLYIRCQEKLNRQLWIYIGLSMAKDM